MEQSQERLDAREQDRRLAEGIRDGDDSAFDELYAHLSRPLYAYLRRLAGNGDDQAIADDVLQDTFCQVVRKIEAFNPDYEGPGGLRAWVYRIATFRMIDMLRQKKRWVLNMDGEGADTRLYESEFERKSNRPDEQLMVAERHAQLEAALDRLPAPMKMCLHLKEYEDMSCLEISRVVGCSESAVKQNVFRARQWLRRWLCD